MDFTRYHTVLCLCDMKIKDFSKLVYIYLLNDPSEFFIYDDVFKSLVSFFEVSNRTIYRALIDLYNHLYIDFTNEKYYILINDLR